MVRVLAVADSDSYLKWSAATLAAMPASWQTEQVVITTPITPSGAQIVAAASGEVAVLSVARLLWKVSTQRPDVLLLGCTGPVVHTLLTNPRLRHGRRRPVLMTGLPGISVPATARAVEFRSACDLFVVHSHRERADFSRLGEVLAPGLTFGLARLPFLPADRPPRRPSGGTRERSDRQPSRRATGDVRPDVVFAAQAKVPRQREQRREVLLALAQTAATGSAVVKLRAADGEEQTHRELWPYPRIWSELVREGRVAEHAVRFSTGSMADALDRAEGFVTVSSTAALEAIAVGIPILVLSDFGVSAELINLVFQESGCLGTLQDLRDGRFFTPDRRWLSDNYFHPSDDSDWVDRLRDLIEERRVSGLRARAVTPVGSRASLARRQLRLVLSARSWRTVSAVRRRLRQLPAGAGGPRPRDRTTRVPLLD
nr:hypothetical protein [Propionibacteriaceae bacterium]